MKSIINFDKNDFMRYKILLIFLFISPLINNLTYGQSIQLKEENGILKIPCKINGLNMEFIFDTGASDVCMSKTEFNFMVKHGYIKSNELKGKTQYQVASGEYITGQQFIIREIVVGNKKFNNIAATVINNNKVPLLFGQSIIKKFGTYTINTKSKVLMLDKNTTSDTDISNDERCKSFGVPLLSAFSDFDATLKERDFKPYWNYKWSNGINITHYSGYLTRSLPKMDVILYSTPITNRVFVVELQINLNSLMYPITQDNKLGQGTVEEYYNAWDEIDKIFTQKYGVAKYWDFNDRYTGTDRSQVLHFYDYNSSTGTQNALNKLWLFKPSDQYETNDRSIFINLFIQGKDKDQQLIGGSKLMAVLRINSEEPGMFIHFLLELEDEKKEYIRTRF